MNQRFLLGTFLLMFVSPILIGQANNIQFENIKTDNGLSAAYVNQVIQDKNDFLWIATTSGLNRFDGVDFKIFRQNKENPNTISDNSIRCLLEDSKGYIWAGTLNSGLNRYDYKTGKFTHFFHKKGDNKSISNNEILSIFEDSQGRLWVGTEHGLNLFDYETETFTSFRSDEKGEKSIYGDAILTIIEDHRNWIWIGTWDGGLNLVIPTENPKKFEFRHFMRGDNSTDLKSNHVWKLFLDKEKRLWLGMYDGGLSVMLPNIETDLKTIVPEFQTFFQEENNQIANNAVMALNQDEFGQIWVATADGLSVIMPKTVTIEGRTNYKITASKNYKNISSNSYSLVNDEIRDIFIDKSGIVWCSTAGGISKFDRNSANFNHFSPSINSDINKAVIAIIEYNKDIVYIAGHSELGLIEYNQKTQTSKSYYLDGEKNKRYKTGLTTFYKVNDESLWIGSRTGIVHFNPITKVFKRYEIRLPNGEFCQVKKIVQDKQNRLWLATNQCLVIFNPKKETFEYIEKDRKGESLIGLDISDILLETENRLWLAAYGGLRRLDFEKDGGISYKTYVNEITNPKSICNNRAISLVLLNGELWVGTENGLAKYNTKTDDFQNFKSSDGLEISAIVSMVEGRDNRLWLGTREGLIFFNPKTSSAIHYNEKDGPQSSVFITNSVCQQDDGTLYFGNAKGYIRFKSENIKSNQYIPPVRITNITVFNKPHAWNEDVAILKEITLQPEENYFTVEFAALNFSQSSDNQYAYKLEGFNDDWVNCGHKKSVSFSNLDGGTYTLRIKGSNNDGVWNEKGVSLKIIVIPPIWGRLWFKILVPLLIIDLGLLAYFIRVNQIKLQKVKLEEEVHNRTKEIRTQKVQIEMLVEELKNQNNQLEEIVKERTKTLERSNLDLVRSNKDLEQFAYVASHDLQEPLRTIGSFTQILTRKYKNEIGADGQLYMANIIGGVKRMSELIKSLLNYSRLGRNDIQFSMADLQDIISDKIMDLGLKIQEKEAEIIIGDLPEKILCEPNQLGVVFYNLINNGLKFNTNPNPIIMVQLEKEDEDYWTFSVADNGIGIDEIYKEKVFEIFQRLNHVSKFEGTGIGLAFCKRIILRHEGNIWFESTLGEGTTFYFTIHKHIKQVEVTNEN
jgi:signal transduction histidine kinase/ligand-binding sensor domain-containing protein